MSSETKFKMELGASWVARTVMLTMLSVLLYFAEEAHSAIKENGRRVEGVELTQQRHDAEIKGLQTSFNTFFQTLKIDIYGKRKSTR